MTEPTRPALVQAGDRVWVWYAESNAVVVAGARGLLVVDALGSAGSACELVDAIRALRHGDVVAVALTHGHDDHVGGLPALRAAWPGAGLHAHESAGVPGVDRPFSSVAAVELGDRVVELAHLGRGHTDNDVVVSVPDAAVLAVGDLADGAGVPRYGADCFPLEWSTTVDLVLKLAAADAVVVPGHGEVLTRSAFEDQCGRLGVAAQTVHDVASGAGGEVGWPFPEEAMREAVRRGLEQVPRAQRRLPLV